MAEEIEFRLPSALPYAYVSVKGTAEELSRINFEMLAALYANGLHAFQEAEKEAAKLIIQGGTAAPEKPVNALAEALQAMAEDRVEPERGGELPGDAVSEIKGQLGATELDSVNAPWERPAKAAKQQPWETDKPKTKPVVDVEGW